MNKSRGAIALVGSGEYLPVMQELESQLLRIAVARGKKNTFVQIPTAAGRESRESIKFWKERGEIQVARIGAQSIFIPVLTREDAFNEDFITLIEDAGLIYFSGGDPGYLAQVFSGTPLWGAIVKAWHDGSSLAGCSAGAMAFGEKIVGIRLTHAINGLGLLPDIEVIHILISS